MARRHRLIAALVSLTVTCLWSAQPVAGRSLEGAAAPDFALAALTGANKRLSEHIGQVVLLNFWATWCGPCRQEMPYLEDIHRHYREAGFTVLGVNLDKDPDGARRMVEDLGVSFPVLLDQDKDVSRLYDVRAMPMTVLIDRDGRVRYVHHGYHPGMEASYLDQVRALVQEE